MTLALAIKATDAIIMATDSRGTIGDPRGLTAINDSQKKLFQLGNCAVAISGSAEVALSVMDELGKRGLDKPNDVDEAVAIFEHVASIYDNWYQNIAHEKRPATIFILGGYRQVDGVAPVPMVYAMMSNTRFAPQLAGKNPMMAGVPQYATYLANRYYDPDINVDHAAALAEYLISETASQDPKVGGPIRIAVVTPDNYRELSDSQISKLQKRNQKLNDDLKQFFITGGGS